MAKLDIIVIGASAGGVEAVSELFLRLKPDLQVAVFIVIHIPPVSKSNLPAILNRLRSIPAEHAQPEELIRLGHAYVAPPNQHMLLQDGRIQLTYGPKENGVRPAVDPLFVSAAKTYGARVIGIILSGNLYDGTMGLSAIHKAGGLTIVQDPEQAAYPSMPATALGNVNVDHVLPIAKIAQFINQMNTPSSLGGEIHMKDSNVGYPEEDTKLIRKEFADYEKGNGQDHRSVLTCPDCGGVLWEIQDGHLIRYRCHVGHTFDPDNLLVNQDDRLENAFWLAVRVLVEKAALANRLAEKARQNGNQALMEMYRAQASKAEQDADLIRNTWFHGVVGAPSQPTTGEQANQAITQENSEKTDEG